MTSEATQRADPFISADVAGEKPEPLKMFASARELVGPKGSHKPLEGDREAVDLYSLDPDEEKRYNTQTWRRWNTEGYSNWENTQFSGVAGPTTSEKKTGPGGGKPYVRTMAGRKESDEELWSRKQEEAYDPYGRQGAEGRADWGGTSESSIPAHTTRRSHGTEGQPLEPHRKTQDYTFDTSNNLRTVDRQLYQHPGKPGMFGGEATLGEAIERHGFDWSRHPEGDFKNPITLQYHTEGQLEAHEKGHTHDTRPQILGGHHRLAVMMSHAPDTPMPIHYAENLRQAKASKRYT
jgi:hypothetical protein